MAGAYAVSIEVEIVKTMGHVSWERRGADLILRCNNCGQGEIVPAYERGGRPRLFGWNEPSIDASEFAKCHACLMVHQRGKKVTFNGKSGRPDNRRCADQ